MQDSGKVMWGGMVTWGRTGTRLGGCGSCAHRLKEPCRTFSLILAVIFPTQTG